jgi:hypothetical protein
MSSLWRCVSRDFDPIRSNDSKILCDQAMWTRFLPIVEAIKTIVNSEELGDVKVLHADLAGDFKLDSEASRVSSRY